MILSCDAIENRKSCRIFDNQRIITPEVINKLIYAASVAPSGKNSQPWRFRLINHETIKEIAKILPNNKWLSQVKQTIAIYLDEAVGYDAEKNAMAIGACIENLLIEAESNGIAACWIGECTDFRDEINKILNISYRYVLMSIVAVGYCKLISNQVVKRSINELMI